MGRMKTVTVDVDVYVDDVISDIDDDELVEELEDRGYYVYKEEAFEEVLDKDDWRKIEDILTELPYHWENEILRKKVIQARSKK